MLNMFVTELRIHLQPVENQKQAIAVYVKNACAIFVQYFCHDSFC